MFGIERVFYDAGDGGGKLIVIEEGSLFWFCGVDDEPALAFGGLINIPETIGLFEPMGINGSGEDHLLQLFWREARRGLEIGCGDGSLLGGAAECKQQQS